MAITMNGVKYKVIDSLGYNHDVGAQVKMIEYEGKRAMVVGSAGRWRLWTASDRTAPLREAVARGWPKKETPAIDDL
jgi:hypothetical protein